MNMLMVMSRIIHGDVCMDVDHRRLYTKLKFKMKLGYECWQRQIDLKDLVFTAIKKTLVENYKVAIKELQDFIHTKDGVPYLNLNESGDQKESHVESPSNDLHQLTALAIVKLNEGELDYYTLYEFIESCCPQQLDEKKQLDFSDVIFNYWDAKDDLIQQENFYLQVSISRKCTNLLGEIANVKASALPLSRRFYVRAVKQDKSKNLIKLQMESLGKDPRPFYHEFFNQLHDMTKKKKMKTRDIEKFITDNLLMVSRGTNLATKCANLS